jgi:hypothetical protein
VDSGENTLVRYRPGRSSIHNTRRVSETMDVGEWIKNLVVDTWYKTFVLAGAALFVLSLSIDVKGMSNGQLQLLSGGLFLLGIGVWKNEKVASWIKPPNVYTGPAALVSTNVRQADFVGLAFECLGGILLFTFAIALIFGGSKKIEQQVTPPPSAAPSKTSPAASPKLSQK